VANGVTGGGPVTDGDLDVAQRLGDDDASEIGAWVLERNNARLPIDDNLAHPAELAINDVSGGEDLCRGNDTPPAVTAVPEPIVGDAMVFDSDGGLKLLVGRAVLWRRWPGVPATRGQKEGDGDA